MDRAQTPRFPFGERWREKETDKETALIRIPARAMPRPEQQAICCVISLCFKRYVLGEWKRQIVLCGRPGDTYVSYMKWQVHFPPRKTVMFFYLALDSCLRHNMSLRGSEQSWLFWWHPSWNKRGAFLSRKLWRLGGGVWNESAC